MLNGGRGGAGRAQGNPRASRAAIPNQAEPQHASFNIHHSAFAVHHSAFAVRHSAFSMVELMFAVVILGIGMLITSSMFPIAWFKAREVAEATVVPALADAAESNIRLLARPSGPVDSTAAVYTSRFFPGDWFPAIEGATDPAVVYPDTRVHHLNLGNYLADQDLAAGGTDFTNNADGDVVPVGDDTWQLEDNLDVLLADSLGAVFFADNSATSRRPLLRPHQRLSLPLSARPLDQPANAASDLEKQHWEERFELRRHCWSAFYRFNELPGLSFDIASKNDLNGDGTEDAADRDLKIALGNRRLRRARQLSMYYFTLKRPVNARYARQAGYDPDASSPAVVDLANPQARGPEFDVRLPVPWRFEAGLKTLPSASAAGVPSEIHVPANTLMATVLDDGYVLLDDRVGQVFRITDRRDGSVDGVASVIFTLDRDYTIVNGKTLPTTIGLRRARAMHGRKSRSGQ
jgi:prepilin-type N-terminal cleavage/methylation domain-containing protein